ncbi:LemA family protein [Methanobrevibacter sp.]
MDLMSILGIIVVIVFIIFIGYTFIHLYNNLVNLRNRVKNSYAQIEVQLKRRNDLIPNLVETVKGYASHEKGVFEEVTKARSNVMNASGVEETSAADNQLTGALKSLFAVAENYPELKANSNFQQLQSELTETEDKIAYARQFYNDVVLKYNNACEQFPSSWFANRFNFEKAEFFDAPESETAVPEVKF